MESAYCIQIETLKRKHEEETKRIREEIKSTITSMYESKMQMQTSTLSIENKTLKEKMENAC